MSRRRRKKNHKLIWILAGLAAVCVLAIVVLFITPGFLKERLPQIAGETATEPETEEKPLTPEEVVSTYFSYLEAQDYEAMYELTSAQSRQNISLEDFITRNQNIYEGIEMTGLVTEILDTEELETTQIVRYEQRMETSAGPISFANNISMNQDQEGEYRIEWSSNLIFPLLLNGDRVRVTTDSSKRGNIFDRNGVLLAGEGMAASVGLVPGKMNEAPDGDIERLAQLLGTTADSIRTRLSASWVNPESFVPLKTISHQETELKEQLLGIPGIMISDQAVRSYPLGAMAAHLTGYVQNINGEELEELKDQGYDQNSIIGKIGLERLMEERLRGSDGAVISIVDQNGNSKSVLAERSAVNGEDIKLTIDAALQQKLYERLKDEASSAVVMNPWTGEVLALVSTPAYDPNEFIMGLSNERWQELNDNPARPMFNRYRASLVPGSSFKPVTAAIGLTTGSIGHDENFGRSGLSWQKDSGWGGYRVTTLKEYGDQVTMPNALIYSDNIYFAKAALQIGEDAFTEALLKLGFDESIPFPFGMTASTFGNDQKFDNEIQLADSGYGQGKILVNPVHMASAYSAFVNQGNMVQPYLEYKEDKTPEIWKEQVFTAEAAELIKNDLIQVIENPNGSGHSAQTPGYLLAGKTGTAEIKASQTDTTGTELGWFNLFNTDPNSDKPYLALVMVENVKGRGGSGFVIPTVKALFED